MKDMSIVVGSHTLNIGGDRYKIKKLVPYEKYDNNYLKNDIAVIQVNGKIKYSDKVQPIELLKEMAPIGKKCLLTGWGHVDYKKKTVPNNLQMLEFETISNDDCTKQLNARLSQNMCPSNNGDSGGPLVIQDDKNKTLQIGVVSWIVPCGKDFPDVFASVHGFHDWIQSKIK
ncbi:chymotrypsin-2-like [Pieris napi]|uniref:chymotrypsin-2-like n=1 Tax=Pieris napi TaxID=78633 RepID=UPI001FBBF5EB|nr:chymotrypsin-2-like [Pieris napi]